jgi:hypothetical protein
MKFSTEELIIFLGVYDDLEKKIREIFHLRYLLKHGKPKVEGNSDVYIDRIDFTNGKIQVVAESNYCSCCSGDYIYCNIDPSYLFIDGDTLKNILLEDVRVELAEEAEKKASRERDRQRNMITVKSTVSYGGKLPMGEIEWADDIDEDEEKEQLVKLLEKHPDTVLEFIEKNNNS